MKRIFSCLCAVVVLFAAATPLSSHAQAAGSNLIANASFETSGQGVTPDNWTANSWGTNTSTLSYATDGNTGNKSARVDMTARTNGDAKWMHDAVTVSGGATYTFSDYYKSNVLTELDAQYTDASGAVRYAYLGSVPASATWKQATATVAVPADVVKVVVMHIIADAGWLQTDDYSLVNGTETPAPTPTPTPAPTPTPTPTPTDGNLIANPSAETANGQVPQAWMASRWGTNTANLTYATTGHTGTKSLHIDMTARTNGDAKWMHDAVTVVPGETYTYTGFYKATTESEIDLQYLDTSGAASYVYVQALPASADWKEISATFVVPSTATKVVVMHILAQVGSLQTDDASLIKATTTTPVPPTPTTPPPVDTDNLIANPSFETASGTSPASWQKNSWGTNSSQFTYDTTGHTGSRSASVVMTSFSSGDAKWFADPVAVVAGKSYLYRDYYKSTVPTRVVAGFVDASGSYSYKELGSAATASDWQQYSTTFTVPTNAVKVTLFHLIDSVGTLTIDDAVLTVAVAAPVTNVPNPSLESSLNGQMPDSWQGSGWGSNSAQYTYVTDAHTGNRSVKVAVSNYVDGDAKWFFTPTTSLTAGKQYRFTTWYKTNAATPKVVVLFVDQSGVEHYVGLPNAFPNGTSNWQQYSETFSVPTGTASVSVFMMLTENAWLQTDDYSITDYVPTGFNRALLSLTFDDGHEDNATTALPLMQQYGIKSTQCFATTFIEGIPSAVANVKAFYDAGHEICSHTVTHPFLTQQTSTDVQYELSHSQDVLQQIIGTAVRNFATPYGDYNESVLTQIKLYYQSHRTVDEGYNTKDNFDIYRLRVQNILDTTTAAEIQQWIAQAQTDKSWLILVYHRVASDPGPYDTYTTVFAQQLAVIQASGIVVKTYQAALDEITPQL